MMANNDIIEEIERKKLRDTMENMKSIMDSRESGLFKPVKKKRSQESLDDTIKHSKDAERL